MCLLFSVVDYDLKSLANAVSMVLMAACGQLPAPIVIGKLIDSACRLWQKDSCGGRGACWIYNADDFRWKLHVAVGACRIVTSFIDLLVRNSSNRMTISDYYHFFAFSRLRTKLGILHLTEKKMKKL